MENCLSFSVTIILKIFEIKPKKIPITKEEHSKLIS